MCPGDPVKRFRVRLILKRKSLDRRPMDNQGDLLVFQFKRTWICISLHICSSHVLLPHLKTRVKYTDVPWRPYEEVSCALDSEMGRSHQASGGEGVKNGVTWQGYIGRRRGDGGIRVSANASREGRRGPGRDDGVCLSAS